jgi:hypothetical protein
VTNDRLVYELRFPEGTSKKKIAHQEAFALDALVAAGKIKEEDRENVTFIVNIIAESPHRRANVDYMESA